MEQHANISFYIMELVQQLIRGETAPPPSGRQHIAEEQGETTGQRTIKGDTRPPSDAESDKDD